jgi:hypothetical protein
VFERSWQSVARMNVQATHAIPAVGK